MADPAELTNRDKIVLAIAKAYGNPADSNFWPDAHEERVSAIAAAVEQHFAALTPPATPASAEDVRAVLRGALIAEMSKRIEALSERAGYAEAALDEIFAAIGTGEIMDQPDGGSPSLAERTVRAVDAIRKLRATQGASAEDAAVLDELLRCADNYKAIHASDSLHDDEDKADAEAKFQASYAACLARMAGKVPTWQPIESAPKDGTEVDLWTDRGERIPDAKWFVSKLGKEGWRYVSLDGFDNLDWVPVEGNPTHWMPRPAAPESPR